MTLRIGHIFVKFTNIFCLIFQKRQNEAQKNRPAVESFQKHWGFDPALIRFCRIARGRCEMLTIFMGQ
ncbi:hypothetical protein SAMN05216227_101146 [Pseudorhodobacter antarcticus]|uniref:Uncharacterized protein n=1 Tax=Pseudorhodobacter antarcticus TaxID=1077947 RepID=A0A1H8FL91_9RHOB|nr:hypothetical protein [Pseudorhodobacter antarcticus]SEN32442.1 hypothetical protein SAMN05216227_101146 [Pseudorhodobacter antarcticus]